MALSPRDQGLLQRGLSFVNLVSGGFFSLNAVLYVLGQYYMSGTNKSQNFAGTVYPL